MKLAFSRWPFQGWNIRLQAAACGGRRSSAILRQPETAGLANEEMGSRGQDAQRLLEAGDAWLPVGVHAVGDKALASVA